MFSLGIITISDKGFAGEREDVSGQVIEDMMKARGYRILARMIVPDEQGHIRKALIHMADKEKVDLILTTGGTGFSKRDITPEVTESVLTRKANGIAEAIRYHSLTITSRAMLSRGISGIRNNSLIINLPGSPKAVKEALDYALDSIEHGLEILLDIAGDCARK